jgi:hypothetical protein
MAQAETFEAKKAVHHQEDALQAVRHQNQALQAASPVCLPHGRTPMSVHIACLAQQREHGRNSNEDWPETKCAELRSVVECMPTI